MALFISHVAFLGLGLGWCHSGPATSTGTGIPLGDNTSPQAVQRNRFSPSLPQRHCFMDSNIDDLIGSASLPRHDRLLLKNFVTNAIDPSLARGHLISQFRLGISEFLSEWKLLIRESLATVELADQGVRKAVLERDKHQCCVTRCTKSWFGEDIRPVQVLSPSILSMPEGVQRHLRAHITEDVFSRLCSVLHCAVPGTTAWCLSDSTIRSFQLGEARLFPTTTLWRNHRSLENKAQDTASYYFAYARAEPSIQLKHPNGGKIIPLHAITVRRSSTTSMVDPTLFLVQSSLASASQWVVDSDRQFEQGARVGKDSSNFSKTVFFIVQYMWLTVPQQIRLSAYRMFDRYLPNSYRLSPNVQRLPFGLVLKHRGSLEVEAAALRTVLRYTTVPVPSIVDFIVLDGHCYLLMTEIRGKPLDIVLNSLLDAEIACLIYDLKGVVSKLRNIPSKGIICSATGWDSPCFDYRLPDDRGGPFANESLFNDFLLSRIHEDEKSRFMPASNHSIFFTHGDLTTRNIIMEGGRLKAILDWECAGYFPEYWEKTKAIYSCKHPDWVDVVNKSIEGYEAELENEKELWDRGSPF